MPYVDVNDVKLHYETVGRGEPMLMLGGAGLARENFDPVIEGLAEQHELLILDQRGYGQSDVTGAESFVVEDWARDAIAFLDAIDVDTAHVAGTSLGGNVALQCGLSYPDRIRSMIIHGCVAKADVSHHLFMKACEDHSRLAGEMDWTVGAFIAEAMADPAFLDQNPSAVDDVMVPRLKRVPLPTWLAAFHAMRTVDQSEALATCEVPALVITGEWARHFLDTAPSGVGLRKMAELLPQGRLHLLDEAGHLVLFEKPAEYVDVVTSFTRDLQGAPVS
jgi:pimeloyl-ACP methyl ester carboxylesterase